MGLSIHTAQASQRHLSTPGFTTTVKPSRYSFSASLRGNARHAGWCTRPCCCVHLLSFRLDGSKNSLVKRDQEEVCPLSREVMFQPLSAPLQDGIRFLLDPAPAPPWAGFAACCPRRERYGVSTFRLQKCVGLGACYRPGGVWVTKAQH
jgi:hypothetical protein